MGGVSAVQKETLAGSEALPYCLYYLSIMNTVAFVRHVSVDGIQKVLRSRQDIDLIKSYLIQSQSIQVLTDIPSETNMLVFYVMEWS